MKIIDKNGRLFGLISIIDVIVILVVAVMGVALYLKTNTMTHTSTATKNEVITYQLLGKGVNNCVVENIKVGDKIYDEDRPSGGCLGEVTAVEFLPGTEVVEFTNGTIEEVPSEDTVNVLLTIRGEGLIDGKSYSLNRIYDLGVNSARNFVTEYARVTATVIAID